MKKLILITLILFLIVRVVLASEGCFVQVTIKEQKVNDQIQFSLLGQKSFYGEYTPIQGTTDYDYSATIQDSSGNQISTERLNSGRFINYEDYQPDPYFPNSIINQGGITELNEGLITLTIPYNFNVQSIKITDASGHISEIRLDFSQLNCNVKCRTKHSFLRKYEKCCDGLTPIQYNNDIACADCNDGTCAFYENKDICPNDCPSCVDECSQYVCVGFEFYECINGANGCKVKVNKGKIVGKCGYVPCKDKCQNDSCINYNYTACELNSEGCKIPQDKGIILGKCSVECLTGADCSNNQQCKNYKCAASVTESDIIRELNNWLNYNQFDELNKIFWEWG